jgi:FSR family fosmidomycin resistance protein-like MFS transporter
LNTDQTNEDKFESAGIAKISLAHAVHDTYTGFFPALLPVLIEKLFLSNTIAGLLSIFLQIPSLFQPLIGHFVDRKNLRLLIVLAPMISGVSMSLLGTAPNYGILILFLTITGISSAFLHAIGPVIGSTFSGKRLGKGMGFWTLGGELGRALGPLVTVTAIGYLTIEKFPWLMIGGVIVSVYLFFQFRDILRVDGINHNALPEKVRLQDFKGIMLPIALLLITRSFTNATLTIFLPTFLKQQGATLWIAGASLTILEVSGMLGVLTAGPLSDRLGRRIMLAISYIITPVLLLLFLRSEGLWQMLILIFLGFFSISIVPVMMALVMENFTNNRSLANGIFMAIIFVVNAIAALIIGLISDLMDLQFTFIISAGILIIGLPVVKFLPKSKPSLRTKP